MNFKLLKIEGITPIRQEEFNTCNGWGFGGGIGTQYTFNNGCYIRVGRAHHRHLPSSFFFCVYDSDGNRLCDYSSVPKKGTHGYFKVIETIIKEN